VREVTVEGLGILGGTVVLRELTIGQMRKLRRDCADDEERGLVMLSQAIISPAVTAEDLDNLPGSAVADLGRLLEALQALQRPEGADTSPPA
jgi:hypothetical protein